MTTSAPSTHDLFSMRGKNVLLTGASAGIGRRFAAVLHDAGANVALVARRKAELEKMAHEMPNCVAVPADLSVDDPLDVHRRAVDAIGEIHVLVNNAAQIAGGVRAEDETPEIIDHTLRLNLVAPIRLGQAVFPSMKARGEGAIVNITSIVAEVGIGRFPQATYAASKGGLAAITREWAAQWSRFGIRVNALAPGFIETEITSEVLTVDRVEAWVLRNTMIPRHGRPDDFDGALLLLASDAGRYITGQTFTVDGGWTAR